MVLCIQTTKGCFGSPAIDTLWSNNSFNLKVFVNFVNCLQDKDFGSKHPAIEYLPTVVYCSSSEISLLVLTQL